MKSRVTRRFLWCAILQAATGLLPAVNQLEFHPWVDASMHETVRWCQSNGASM